jgi:hypothetical protein
MTKKPPPIAKPPSIAKVRLMAVDKDDRDSEDSDSE